jgi:hypothetical protein
MIVRFGSRCWIKRVDLLVVAIGTVHSHCVKPVHGGRELG